MSAAVRDAISKSLSSGSDAVDGAGALIVVSGAWREGGAEAAEETDAVVRESLAAPAAAQSVQVLDASRRRIGLTPLVDVSHAFSDRLTDGKRGATAMTLATVQVSRATLLPGP